MRRSSSSGTHARLPWAAMGALAAAMLVVAIGVLTAVPAQAVTPAQAVSPVELAAGRDCHSGDLNDCRISEVFGEEADAGRDGGDEAEQGVAAPIGGRAADYPVRVVERSPAIRCWLTQNTSPECAPYLRGQTFAENVFFEGSELDDDTPAAFVNGRGREVLCWVDGKGRPCSKVLGLIGDGVERAAVD